VAAAAAVAASPPFTKVNQDTVQTSDGTQFQLFEGVRQVIEYLLARPTEYTVRIASASQASTCAKQLLSMFGFPQRLTRGAQIYSANKIKHLTTIGKETNIPLRSKCVFFDDLKMFAEMCYKVSAEDMGKILRLLEKDSPGCLVKKPNSNEVEINVDLIKGRVFRNINEYVLALCEEM
jgi:predicted phosphatase